MGRSELASFERRNAELLTLQVDHEEAKRVADQPTNWTQQRDRVPTNPYLAPRSIGADVVRVPGVADLIGGQVDTGTNVMRRRGRAVDAPYHRERAG
jgi:hypothetical protein